MSISLFQIIAELTDINNLASIWEEYLGICQYHSLFKASKNPWGQGRCDLCEDWDEENYVT